MINVLLFAILLLGWSEPHRCSIGLSFVGPSLSRAILLVEATGRTSLVPVPQHPLYREAIPDSVREVLGYQFRVIAVKGGTTSLHPGDTLIAVPWAYNASCDPDVWGQGEWVPRGADAVFAISDFRVYEGVLVIDKLGWHSPYPHGEFLKYAGVRTAPADRREWLSAREYYDMVLALPPEDSAVSRAERARHIERIIENGNPRWRLRFPGNELLRRVRAQRSN